LFLQLSDARQTNQPTNQPKKWKPPPPKTPAVVKITRGKWDGFTQSRDADKIEIVEK
jgi:hypothetical protein